MEKEKLISLVTNAQQGDQDALNDLFNTYYNDVYYFALKTIKDEETACDVTQETFVEIINTLGNLQEPAAFVKWMKQITYHQCTRYFKKKKDVIVDEDEDGNTIFDTLQEDKAEFIPDEALDKDEFKKTIMAMIDDLSEEQRAAVMMFYYDELSIKQIAEIQGTNENTVKSRLNYAKKGIKKSVEDYEKKNGVKLHCVGVLPLLLWLFKDYYAQSAPASATIVAESVAATTGTAVTITATAATTTTVTTATTAAAVGIGAKIAALPIATKVVAGIVAATIAIGGGATVLLSQQEPAIHDDDSTLVSESGSTESESSQASLENKLRSLPGVVHELGYFDSADKLSTGNVFSWASNQIEPTSESKDFDNYIFTYTYAVSSLNAVTERYFGNTWDYSSLPDMKPGGEIEYIYNEAAQTVAVIYRGAFGDAGPEISYESYTAIDDTHYEILYTKSYWGQTPLYVSLRVELSGDRITVLSQTAISSPEDDEPLYYDLSRVTDSSLTAEEIARRALANAEHTGGETYDDPPMAIYAVDYAASCFTDMDIFGYGVTVYEMCGLGWGGVDFYSYLVGDDLAVQLNSTSFYLRLPIEQKSKIFDLASQDVQKFAALLNGSGDPYVFINGTSKRGLDNLTDEALMNAVDGTGSSPVEIFTSERFAVDGKEFGLSMTINSSNEDGVLYYCIYLSIGFFNE